MGFLILLLLRVVARSFRWLLCRILCLPFQIGGFVEQFIRNRVSVMLPADGDAVTDPLRYGILRELHCPLLLTGASERLPELLPRLDFSRLPDIPNLSDNRPLP